MQFSGCWLKNQKQMKDIHICYLFNKIAVGLNNGLLPASEPGKGSHDHVSVHGGECLSDGDHQASFDVMALSVSQICPNIIVHQIRIWARFGRFMAKDVRFFYFSTKSP